MLGIMRRGHPYLKWVLLLVVLSFILFFNVDWWNYLGTGGIDPTVAVTVNGTPISRVSLQQEEQQLDRRLRQQFGENYQQFRAQLGVPRMALENVIQHELVMQDARRLGLAISDEEIQAFILNQPGLQRDGRFIGLEEYERLLRANGMTVAEYEANIEEDLLSSKWQHLIGTSAVVAKTEIEAEYKRRHEKLNVEYLWLPYDKYQSADATPSDAELRSYYQANLVRYKEGEGRRAIYALFDDAAADTRIQVSDAEIAAYYEANKQKYELPEARRARHILISASQDAPAAEVDAAERKARGLLAQIRGGADLAALAAQFSDDPGSKTRGGDLGFFPRGQMVAQFDEAVFSMAPGQVSDLIRTEFGFHIIRVEETRPAGSQPLEQVRRQVEAELKFPRRRQAVEQLASEFIGKLNAGIEFNAALQQLGLTPQDSGVVTRTGTVPGMGAVPSMVEAIFSLEKGKHSQPIVVPRGQVVARLQEVLPDYIPPFEARRERVRTEYLRDNSKARVRAELSRASSSGDLAAAAKSLKLELMKAPAFVRGSELPDVGYDAKLEEQLFAAAPGRLTAPLEGGRGMLVARVISREQADLAKLSQEEATIRDTLRGPRVQAIVNAKLEELRKNAAVLYSQEIQQLVGGAQQG